MAAEELARAGLSVLVAEAKPSAGRKFLMAGKSGLNLTNAAGWDAFLPQYFEAAPRLAPILAGFDAKAVQDWARGLGQEVFTGSTGRVFPVAMKASPLLRAWLGRLGGLGVELRTRWRWVGFDGDAVRFETPEGAVSLRPKVTVLALGGASWARLGSDGQWAEILGAEGVPLVPFQPMNVGVAVDWSEHMARQFGAPVKGVRLTAGNAESRGEVVISARGLEGGGIYALSRALRDGAPLMADLMPDWTVERIAERLAGRSRKESLSTRLRKALRLDPARVALLQEFARPMPVGMDLARRIKALPIRYAGLGPMDQAISTAGGVAWEGVDDGLMLTAWPGVFVAGEMLDWEAPTGGYLLNGCFATGRWAGQHAARFASGE